MRYAGLAILNRGRRLMICEIWELLVDECSIEVSYMTIQHILAAEGDIKVCVRWIHKQSTDENKEV